MKAKQIKIKYVREDMERIKSIKNGDWIDLRTGIDLIMRKGDFRLIPLGVAMQLPENTEALVIPRSSTFKKYGIIQANSVGLIDESYCGEKDEWMFPAYATRDIVIPKNTRICQFRIQEHQPLVTLTEVEFLSGTSRGGFGSTGER
ncbi:MAG TPA: deoxyuridine 5'-triphosphate nucleotidohydrolase [Lachnospiraceae bacterium]|nr:deoxyuridine 5'-triphosphate nucleotidohydrolase [Lachnospiraceae bacterium]